VLAVLTVKHEGADVDVTQLNSKNMNMVMMMVKQLHLYTSLFIDMSAIIWIQWSDDHSVHTPRLEVKGPAPYAIHDFPGTIARKYDMGDHVKKLLYDILM